MSDKFTVGQVVYRQQFRRSHEAELPMAQYEITKIGRKWVEAKPVGSHHGYRERFDKDTGCEDGRGYSSGARYWPNPEEYETEKKLREGWSSFRKQFDLMGWNRPEHITLEDIAALRAILKLES